MNNAKDDPDLLQQFARLLVQEVRDPAIRDCDVLMRPDSRIATALRWRRAGATTEALAAVIPDVVDTALFFLLRAIDEGLLGLKYVALDGRDIDLTLHGRGELAGWYIGNEGWRAAFAQERFVDEAAEAPA